MQVDKFGDKDKITSNSLRSLCKTVLNDTNPTTNSASDRSKVIINILAGILPGKTSGSIDTAKLAECATLVSSEEAELSNLKGMLGTQVIKITIGFFPFFFLMIGGSHQIRNSNYHFVYFRVRLGLFSRANFANAGASVNEQ